MFCNNLGVVDGTHKTGWNDVTSSILVGPLTTVTLYEKYNFKGKHVALKASSPNLVNSGFNDIVSSLHIKSAVKPVIPHHLKPHPKKVNLAAHLLKPKVQAGCALIFRKKNFQGTHVQICEESVKLEKQGWKNWQVLSVIIGQSTVVNLYESAGLKGHKLVLAKDDSDVAAHHNFKGKVLSGTVIITPAAVHKAQVHKQAVHKKKAAVHLHKPKIQSGCALLFRKKNFQGTHVQICEESANLNKEGWKNWQVLSLMTGENTVVKLYESVGLKGKKIEVAKDDPDVAAHHKFKGKVLSGTVTITPPAVHKAHAHKQAIHTKKVVVAHKPASHAHKAKAHKAATKAKAKVHAKVKAHAKAHAANKIAPGCFEVYEHPKFVGKSKKVCGNVPDIDFGKASVKIGNFTVCDFWEHKNYKGKKVQVLLDEPNHKEHTGSAKCHDVRTKAKAAAHPKKAEVAKKLPKAKAKATKH